MYFTSVWNEFVSQSVLHNFRQTDTTNSNDVHYKTLISENVFTGHNNYLPIGRYKPVILFKAINVFYKQYILYYKQ
jgi:hypothetical protein